MEAASNAMRSLASEIRAFIERARQSIDDEIRHYPTPIPRCDAQFNHLYEQRARLARELTAAAESNDAPALVRAFAMSAPFGDSDDERQLRARAAAALADPAHEALH
ncbi:MAG TPA: hypothetical protein VGA51_05625 [Casimicrobiaceae bacterium]